MKDLMGLMGKAKEMQAKFEAMQQEVASIEATGQAGGGMVSVTLSGKMEMRALKIDPSLFKDDEVEIPVQILGKLRGKVVVPADADAQAIEAAARADDRIAAQLAGKTVRKVVVVPGRLINFVERYAGLA